MPSSHMSSKPVNSKQIKKVVRKQINFIFMKVIFMWHYLLHREY